jgi:hypothetical protein
MDPGLWKSVASNVRGIGNGRRVLENGGGWNCPLLVGPLHECIPVGLREDIMEGDMKHS